MDNVARPVGRPRDRRVDEAITRAVRELLAEGGYTGLTVDAVAARAGAGKAAIYRRYASKQEMVFAAAVHGEVTVPDTGSLLGDLTALVREIISHLDTPAAGAALMAVLGDIAQDESAAKRFTRSFVHAERAGNARLLEQALRRGELRSMPDVELFHALVGGTVLSWIFVARMEPESLPERLAHFVHTALLAQYGP